MSCMHLLFMQACMYVCIYVYMYVCMYACLKVRIYVYVNTVCMYAFLTQIFCTIYDMDINLP